MPVTIHLPPPYSPALESALEGILGWTEFVLEKQRTRLEVHAGRTCYFRKTTEEEIIAFVQQDPGAIGVVSASASLPEGVITLWSSASSTQE